MHGLVPQENLGYPTYSTGLSWLCRWRAVSQWVDIWPSFPLTVVKHSFSRSWAGSTGTVSALGNPELRRAEEESLKKDPVPITSKTFRYSASRKKVPYWWSIRRLSPWGQHRIHHLFHDSCSRQINKPGLTAFPVATWEKCKWQLVNVIDVSRAQVRIFLFWTAQAWLGGCKSITVCCRPQSVFIVRWESSSRVFLFTR